MKTSRFLFLFILISIVSTQAIGQKENNVWAFGNGFGIDFNISPPSLITTAIKSFEGCASICDTGGNLLFYSNSLNVWDRTHNVMPNGSDLLGDITFSATMGTAITAIPDNPDLYFLFTLNQSGELRYSLINMALNSGKGDIVSGTKNILLDTGMSEKMIVAGGCACVWLITHDDDSAKFYAYKITSAEIPPPVISYSIGKTSKQRYHFGEMKISGDFKKICVATPSETTNVRILDFDNKSGRISGYIVLDSTNNVYSLEFSPDGSKLYVVNYSNIKDTGVYQYDLALLPDTKALNSSKYLVTQRMHFSAIKGPDGKIYLVNGSGFLGRTVGLSRINNPNKSGVACNLELGILSTPGKSLDCIILGNNTVRHSGRSGTNYIKVESFNYELCEGKTYNYVGNDSTNFHTWNDSIISKDRVFDTSGLYWVTSIKDCTTYIDSIRIQFARKDTVTSNRDSNLCKGSQWVIQSKKEYNNFLWSDGSINRINTLESQGIKWVRSIDSNCKVFIDTFKVLSTIDCKRCIVIPNAFSPNNDNKNETFKVFTNCPVMEYKLLIFNRFGQSVFQSNDIAMGWNGKFRGLEEVVGVYYYLIKAKFDYPGAPEEIYKGDITLIR